MRHLILFDIDGTLLQCGRQVAPLFLSALRETFSEHLPDGRVPLEGVSFAGKTDPMIVSELARIGGIDEEVIPDLLPRMRSLYLERLERGLRGEEMRLLPGVVELLERLAGRSDLLIGLLTGNWRGGAEIKLARGGLGSIGARGYFRLGAFGDDAVDRRGLVPVALERAGHHRGEEFVVDDVLIIGDTPLDVDCARAAGVSCLAVATGFTPAEELAAAGADHVYPSLLDAAQDHPLLRG
ncbi:MAG: HAD family hydrolase [Acidobacteriota bacterium]